MGVASGGSAYKSRRITASLCSQALVRHETLEIVLVTPRQNSNTLTNASSGVARLGTFSVVSHTTTTTFPSSAVLATESLPFSKNDTQLIGKHKSLGVERLLLLLESLQP